MALMLGGRDMLGEGAVRCGSVRGELSFETRAMNQSRVEGEVRSRLSDGRLQLSR